MVEYMEVGRGEAEVGWLEVQKPGVQEREEECYLLTSPHPLNPSGKEGH